MISDTNKTMLNLIASAIHGQSIEGIDASKWEAIYEELKAQSIHVLPAPCVNKLGMNDSLRKQYTNDIGKNLQQFYAVLEEQNNVLSCLEKANISCVILKGASAAIHYPNPELYIPFQVNHLHGQTEPVPRRMRATLTETEPVLFDVNYQTTVC